MIVIVGLTKEIYMIYTIIIILAFSLPATALASPLSKNTPSASKIHTTVALNKSKQETEELRSIIEKNTGREVCDPKQESKMPTFY